MKQISYILVILFLLLFKSNSIYAQYTFFTPEGSFAIEVSMDNTDTKRLPIYRNAITSLTISNKNIIGGTSAENKMSPFLFIASLEKRELTYSLDLQDIVKEQSAIRSGFVKDNNEQLFAGTMPNELNQMGGHLIKINVEQNSQLTVEDMGIPVPGEGIFTIIGNDEKNKIYGITHPSGYFFVYNIPSKETRVFKDLALSKEIVQSLEVQFSLTPKDLLSNALVVDDQGRVFGSLPFGKLFYFNSNTQKLHEIETELPEVWGRRSLGQVQSWVKTKAGKLYGGNRADGQLFELNPNTKHIKNIGKPIMMPEITGLVEGADGKIYGVAGGHPAYAHLFSYDEKNGFRDYGNPEFEMVAPGIEQGIPWRGYQLITVAASEDGKYIVMGENESLSQLLVFTTK
jgi:hypothetical protein